MKARELFEQVKPLWEKYEVDKKLIAHMPEGAQRDVLDRENVGYYQFLPPLIEHLKPKQVVELGGAMGVAAVLMLSSLPKESKLYSITLEENGLEFSYMKEKSPNFVPIVGDDLDLSNWGDLDLRDTDLWFFDSLHTYQQLSAEIELYSPFFKKGTVVLVDDIHMSPGMFKAWTEFPGDKFDATAWLHYSGYGIICI